MWLQACWYAVSVVSYNETLNKKCIDSNIGDYENKISFASNNELAEENTWFMIGILVSQLPVLM